MMQDQLDEYILSSKRVLGDKPVPEGWEPVTTLPIRQHRPNLEYLMDNGRIETAPGVSNTHLLVLPGIVVGWRYACRTP